MTNYMNKKRKGAFAFEYIIVLVLMVAVIMVAWGLLGQVVMDKAKEISDFVAGCGVDPNGQNYCAGLYHVPGQN